MDPQQQQAANMMTGVGVGVIIFVFLIFVVFLGFTVYCLWRIFTKAGLSGPLSLLMFVPGIGGLVVLCILAFADWKVVPSPLAHSGLQPYPPPTPPSYPPAPPSVYPPPPPTL